MFDCNPLIDSVLRHDYENCSLLCMYICWTHWYVQYHRHIQLNILDTWLANQTAARGMVTIICRSVIRKMAKC